MDYKSFYTQIGNLMYSVAAIDRHIKDEEVKKSLEIVKKSIVPIEDSRDEFGTDAGYFAEFQFDICRGEDRDPKEAYDEFIQYVHESGVAQDSKLRNLVMKIAGEIASAFYGINKTELNLLIRLEKDLTLHKA